MTTTIRTITLSIVVLFASLFVAAPADASAHRVEIDQAALTDALGVCEEGYRVTVFVTHSQFRSAAGASELTFHTASYDPSDMFSVQLYCGRRSMTAPASGITVH